MTRFALTRLLLLSSGAMAVAGCATYSSPEMTNLFYQVPCGTPGSFQAQIAPGPLPAENTSTAARATDAQQTSTALPATETTTAIPSTTQSICLASAGSAPRSYASRAYGYYGDYWRPYRSYGYLGVGLSVGHHSGGHIGGGHHGGGRHH